MALSNRRKFILILLTSLFVLSAIIMAMNQKSIHLLYPKKISNINPSVANELILNNETLILDVRNPEEYDVSHLAKAMRYEPDLVNGLELDTPILVYCTVGVRSGKLAKELQDKGFTNVKNIDLGIINWKNKGFGVVDKNGGPTEKVHVYNRFFGTWLKKGEGVK